MLSVLLNYYESLAFAAGNHSKLPLCGFGPLLTNLFSGCIIRTISYAVQVPPALLGIWRRIVNPVRIRNGTATVCEEAPHGMKVRHWDYFLRRQCGKLMIRESGDLLEQVARVFCVILQWALCLLWKNGHGSVMLPWLFRILMRFADCRWQAVSVSLSVRGKSFAPFPLPHPGIGKQRPQKEEESK